MFYYFNFPVLSVKQALQLQTKLQNTLSLRINLLTEVDRLNGCPNCKVVENLEGTCRTSSPRLK